MKRYIFIIALMLAAVRPALCQYALPNLTFMGEVPIITGTETRTLAAQNAAQLFMTEGHVFVGREVKATVDFQKQFLEYLQMEKDIITAAAQLYGIYSEVKRVTKNINDITGILASAPANAIAVTLTPGRNRLYSQIYTTAAQVANDIYDVCLKKEKRTEQDRNRTLDRIRKNLNKMSKNLEQLALYLRYTTLEDVLNNILDRANYCDPHTKREIADRAFRNWHRVAARGIY